VPTASTHRRTWSRRLLVGFAAGLVVVAAGCSTPAPKQQELADALVDSGLSRKVADCTAKAFTGTLSSSELSAIAERGAGGAPVDDPKQSGEDIDDLLAAMAKCRDLHIATQPTTTLTPSTTAPAGETSSTVTPGTDGTEGAELNPASSTTTTTP
jgi:hypothetical protein